MKIYKYLVAVVCCGFLLSPNAEALLIKRLFSGGFDTVTVDGKDYDVEALYKEMMVLVDQMKVKADKIVRIKGMFMTTVGGNVFSVKEGLEQVHKSRLDSVREEKKLEHTTAALNLITLLTMPKSWADVHAEYGTLTSKMKVSLDQLRAKLPKPTLQMWHQTRAYLESHPKVDIRYGQGRLDWWNIQDSWFQK